MKKLNEANHDEKKFYEILDSRLAICKKALIQVVIQLLLALIVTSHEFGCKDNVFS